MDNARGVGAAFEADRFGRRFAFDVRAMRQLEKHGYMYAFSPGHAGDGRAGAVPRSARPLQALKVPGLLSMVLDLYVPSRDARY